LRYRTKAHIGTPAPKAGFCFTVSGIAICPTSEVQESKHLKSTKGKLFIQGSHIWSLLGL
jgi:hypothetical protein